MKDDLRETEVTTKRPMLRRVLSIGAVVIFTVATVVAVRYYIASRHFEKTDDAFLQATVTIISPQISGRVVSVRIADNEPVHAGDLLVEIDPEPLEAELARVRAAADLAKAHAETARLNVGLTRQTTGADVSGAEATVQASEAAVAQAESAVKAAQSDAERAREDAKRYEGLLRENIASAQQRDAAVSASVMADARLAEAEKRLAAMRAEVENAKAKLDQAHTAPQQVAMTESEVRQFEAEVAQAEASAKRIEIDLAHTKIYSPADGTITRKSVHTGETVQMGQALFSLVQNDLWVEANFKETQLTDMRVEQPVEIEVDAFSGQTFKGHVQSIQSGTGAQFSLLPPQNATGNYVKVVQRVPVKIVFDDPLPKDLPMVPGMSVVPRVKVR